MAKERVKQRAVRATPRQWAIINDRAREAGMERSAYMLACVAAPDDSVERHDREQRLTGAEQREMFDLVGSIARQLENRFGGLPVGRRSAAGSEESVTVPMPEAVRGIHMMVEALDDHPKR